MHLDTRQAASLEREQVLLLSALLPHRTVSPNTDIRSVVVALSGGTSRQLPENLASHGNWVNKASAKALAVDTILFGISMSAIENVAVSSLDQGKAKLGNPVLFKLPSFVPVRDVSLCCRPETGAGHGSRVPLPLPCPSSDTFVMGVAVSIMQGIDSEVLSHTPSSILHQACYRPSRFSSARLIESKPSANSVAFQKVISRS